MGRHWYTAGAYAEAVERIARDLPVFALGADIIAGFPGETDDDHRATLSLVGSLPFTYLHVFPYSRRPGTAAERLKGHVHGGVVQERGRELRTLGESKARAYRGRRAGGVADVVVVRGDLREGMTEDYLSVPIAEPAPPRGSRLPMRLQGDADRLIARPLVPAPPA